MRVLFIQQDHMSPTGPVGEALAGIRALARTEARIRSMHEHGHESTGTN